MKNTVQIKTGDKQNCSCCNCIEIKCKECNVYHHIDSFGIEHIEYKITLKLDKSKEVLENWRLEK